MALIKIDSATSTSPFPVVSVSFVYQGSVNNGSSELVRSLKSQLADILLRLPMMRTSFREIGELVNEIANYFLNDFVRKYTPTKYVTFLFQSMGVKPSGRTIIYSFSITPWDVKICAKTLVKPGSVAPPNTSTSLEWSALYNLHQ